MPAPPNIGISFHGHVVGIATWCPLLRITNKSKAPENRNQAKNFNNNKNIKTNTLNTIIATITQDLVYRKAAYP